MHRNEARAIILHKVYQPDTAASKVTTTVAQDAAVMTLPYLHGVEHTQETHQVDPEIKQRLNILKTRNHTAAWQSAQLSPRCTMIRCDFLIQYVTIIMQYSVRLHCGMVRVVAVVNVSSMILQRSSRPFASTHIIHMA